MAPLTMNTSDSAIESVYVSRSTTPSSTENPQQDQQQQQLGLELELQQQQHQYQRQRQYHSDTIPDGRRSTPTLSTSGLQGQSIVELVDEKVQLNQEHLSVYTNNTNNFGDSDDAKNSEKVTATTDPTIDKDDEQNSLAPSSSATPASSETVEPIRAHYYEVHESHLHLHHRQHTSHSTNNSHISDPNHADTPQSQTCTSDSVFPATTSPLPSSTTPTISLNRIRGSYQQEISLEDARFTTCLPPSGTPYKPSYPRPVSPTYCSHIFSGDTSSFTSSSPLSPPSSPSQPFSGSQYIPSFSLLASKEVSNTPMGYSPPSDATSRYRNNEHPRLASDPELTDLEPSDQRQTKSMIDKHAAAEHSMDRGEHSQLYSHPHPRGPASHTTALPLEERQPQSARWSISTTGLSKPHNIIAERTGVASVPVGDMRHLPLSSRDSNAVAAVRTTDDGIPNSSNAATEAEGTGSGVGTAHPLKVLSARGTPKGPLPIDVQINLLTSVLKHDPFNCPIRRTTQVWERISKEQGIRARTCARRYDNIIQANIAGRDRPIGTEEQMATKKRLLELLYVMMNQPQAIVRMQKKRRYRSEEADKKLLLETIRLNPFGQKVGQVAKAWEDVRDALGMTVHARQCIRRVNRMIKPYQLRERMYKGNIPEELRESNDDLVKQVIQLMYLGGHYSGSLEEDDGQSNDDDSASGMSDDQDDGLMGSEARKRVLPQDEDELEEDDDDVMTDPFSTGSSHTPSTQIPGAAEPTTATPKDRTALTEHHQLHNSGYGSTDKKKRQKEAGTNDSTRTTQPHEFEFRQQRIWGPYPSSRSANGSYGPRNRSSRTPSVTEVTERQYDIGYASRTRESDTIPYGSELNHESAPVQHPSSDIAYRPSAALSPRSAHASSSARGSSTIDSTSHLYQTVLHEFHVVKDYLGRLEEQRRQDKDSQKAMFNVIEKLQYQVQEQQRYIEDLQYQMQNGYSSRSYHESSSTAPLQHAQRSNRHYDNSPPTQHHSYTHHHRHSQSGRELSRSPST